MRQRESSDDNPKVLKDEWNKFANFLGENTYEYEITSIYHKGRERVSAKYNIALYIASSLNLAYKSYQNAYLACLCFHCKN